MGVAGFIGSYLAGRLLSKGLMALGLVNHSDYKGLTSKTSYLFISLPPLKFKNKWI